MHTLSITQRLERSIRRYGRQHAEQYRRFAEAITPNPSDPDAVYTRVAFAILSANAPFESAVQALGHCRAVNWDPDPFILAGYKMVPAKAAYIRALVLRPAGWYLRRSEESFHEQRKRLKTEVDGLGWAKASFAVALLDPLHADVACIDTWMQKVLLGRSSFRRLSWEDYATCEAWVRRVAQRLDVSTFLAQWLTWDHARGAQPNDHNIFPGNHKGTEWIIE